jgi:hypothetical protein
VARRVPRQLLAVDQLAQLLALRFRQRRVRLTIIEYNQTESKVLVIS